MPGAIDWTRKRNEWISLVTALIDDITNWCEELGWSASRASKQITEEHIGSYEAPCLTIHAPSGRIHIDPVGVNIIGAQGRVDILSFPNLNRLLLVRKDNCWALFTESRVPWPQQWSKTVFFEIIQSLAA